MTGRPSMLFKPPVNPAPTPASPLQEVQAEAIAVPAVPVATEEAATPSAPMELSEQAKEDLAKVSLFTGGVVSINVNTATEEEVIALAKDMMLAGEMVAQEFTEMAAQEAAEQIAEEAKATGVITMDIPALDPNAIIDVMMAVEPRVLSPADSAAKREEGRAYVHQLSLGSAYLESPIPQDDLSTDSFEDAVGMLAEAILRPDK